MKNLDITLAITVFIIFIIGAALLIGAVCYDAKHNYDPTPVAEQVAEPQVDFSHPDRYYLYILYKYDQGFKDAGLYTILGPEKDKADYTVDANPKVQEYMDKLLWGYCLQTSDLFYSVTTYMKEESDYSGSMFNVLYNIIHRQQEVLDKYGSSRMKEDANVNTFKHEQEYLASLNPVNQINDISNLLTKIRNN
jgi:hypothetical protein